MPVNEEKLIQMLAQVRQGFAQVSLGLGGVAAVPEEGSQFLAGVRPCAASQIDQQGFGLT